MTTEPSSSQQSVSTASEESLKRLTREEVKAIIDLAAHKRARWTLGVAIAAVCISFASSYFAFKSQAAANRSANAAESNLEVAKQSATASTKSADAAAQSILLQTHEDISYYSCIAVVNNQQVLDIVVSNKGAGTTIDLVSISYGVRVEEKIEKMIRKKIDDRVAHCANNKFPFRLERNSIEHFQFDDREVTDKRSMPLAYVRSLIVTARGIYRESYKVETNVLETFSNAAPNEGIQQLIDAADYVKKTIDPASAKSEK